MKITCNSCGSKYTIADAKVQGKKVKVRCKGCKESILVDGTNIGPGGSDDSDDGDAEESVAEVTGDSSPEAATGPAAPKTAAPAASALKGAKPAGAKPSGLWSVNITDDDSRDMTLAELVAGWKSGLITSDAYVWKDGMGDWKPILEVGELKLKLGPAPKKGGVVTSTAGAGIKSPDKMDDLFGAAASAGNIASDPDPKPRLGGGDAGKPTGARNDSSVLFSLDSLTGDPGAAAKPKARADDLFGSLGTGGPSLTGNMDLLTAPAKDPPPAPAGARIAAPVAIQESKGKGPLIGAILGGALIIGAAIFFLGGSGADPEAEAKAAEVQAKAEEALKKAEEAQKQAEAERTKMQEELKKAREEALKAGKDPDKAEAEAKAEQDKKDAEAKEAEAKEAEAKTAAGTPTTTSGKATSPSPAPAAAPAPAPAASGGAAFDVGAARAALSAAAANAASCAKPGGPTGEGKVQVTFSNSGRVTAATVISGPFGGTAVGGCVASTFRRARVPAFSGATQTVAKSFRIN